MGREEGSQILTETVIVNKKMSLCSSLNYLVMQNICPLKMSWKIFLNAGKQYSITAETVLMQSKEFLPIFFTT